uniref:Uncharacterized protein n=1 Tax=Romanomermis culicivorax TaxID=13658 RepID=A0A915JCT0_ROMCU
MAKFVLVYLIQFALDELYFLSHIFDDIDLFKRRREEENAAHSELITYQKKCMKREHEAGIDVLNQEKAAVIAKGDYYKLKKALLSGQQATGPLPSGSQLD